MCDTNLLTETINYLKQMSKSPIDVCWVGSLNGVYTITWKEFEKIADILYDSGYGGQEISKDLVIVGKDWWLGRREYDGAESWKFHTLPVMPPSCSKTFNTICNGDSWATIEEMNRPEGKYN